MGARQLRRWHAPARRHAAARHRARAHRRRSHRLAHVTLYRRLVSLPSLLDAIERLPAFIRLFNTLPAPRSTLRLTGLPGSADATLVAALARRLPARFLVVAADGVPQAERLLADLHTLLDETPVALYPPREGFGEAEPHVEVAGERVETLERLSRGEIRVLLTTPRALLERTRLPGALEDLRIELRKGDVRRPRDLADHLERIGFERVPMVDDVAQFSLRGGIFDVYSFGMTDPVRLEFWGDEVVDLRHFDLASQRSTRTVDVAVVLPIDGQVSEDAAPGERLSVSALFPPDTLLVYPVGAHLLPELRRTWDEAAHHLELARRRGEDVAPRDELFESPQDTAAVLGSFAMACRPSSSATTTASASVSTSCSTRMRGSRRQRRSSSARSAAGSCFR